MKHVQLFLVFLFALGLGTSFAQEIKDNSVWRVPNLSGNSNSQITNPFQNTTLANTAFAHCTYDSSMVSMPIPGGNPFTVLSETELWYASSMTRGGDGKFYLTEMTGPTLFEFDPVSGNLIQIGYIVGLSPSESLTGFAYNPADGKYYIGTQKSLHTLNMETLITTWIGEYGVTDIRMVDICFDANGNCYGYDINYNSAFSIDVDNWATATLIGPLGYEAGYDQGMSYDFETGTIYLSAYDSTTNTGQLRTMDPTTGNTTLLVDWGLEQIGAFAINCPFYPVDIASNPSPANGTTNVSGSLPNITWQNGAGTTQVELYFGQKGNVQQVYSGPAITSWNVPAPLLNNKVYQWKIICKNDTVSTHSAVWSFTTEQNPNAVNVFAEHFDNMNCWTWIGPLGQTNWSLNEGNIAGGAAPELSVSWTPVFNGLSQLLSCPINSSGTFINYVTIKHKAWWWMLPAPTASLAITYDGGATSTTIWEYVPDQPMSDPEEATVSFSPTSNTYQLILSINGNSDNLTSWYFDDITVDYVTPVELASFDAEVQDNSVVLNWLTASETNNRGFEVERKASNWEKIGFVEGNGTTTETKSYSFTDRNIITGSYIYRLKQIDFDGTYSYSKEVEVWIGTPKEYSLEQNYPNPFNPSTKIKYVIPEESFVTIKIFDVLGREVTTLVNEVKQAGSYELEFRGEELSTGMYMYRMESGNFISTQKMLLLK